MTHHDIAVNNLAAAYADDPAMLRVALFGFLMGALHASKDAADPASALVMLADLGAEICRHLDASTDSAADPSQEAKP